MICPHGHDEGTVERLASPEEVDAGCELGVAFDPCPECKADTLLGVPDFDIDWTTCPYFRRGLPGADPNGSCSFGCVEEPNCITGMPREGWPGMPTWPEHPDYDMQAETGQGPPA